MITATDFLASLDVSDRDAASIDPDTAVSVRREDAADLRRIARDAASEGLVDLAVTISTKAAAIDARLAE